MVGRDVVEEIGFPSGHLLNASTTTKNDGYSIPHSWYVFFPKGHWDVAMGV